MQLASNGRKCVDASSCAAENGGCAHICEEKDGKFYRCRCNAGYKIGHDKRSCIGEHFFEIRTNQRLEERALGHSFINPSVISIQTLDLCKLLCPLQKQQHLAIDPCLENKGGCQHHCVSENGKAHCQCYPGFRLSYDRRTCVDVDECAQNKHECQHDCVNVHGSFR